MEMDTGSETERSVVAAFFDHCKSRTAGHTANENQAHELGWTQNGSNSVADQCNSFNSSDESGVDWHNRLFFRG